MQSPVFILSYPSSSCASHKGSTARWTCCIFFLGRLWKMCLSGYIVWWIVLPMEANVTNAKELQVIPFRHILICLEPDIVLGFIIHWVTMSSFSPLRRIGSQQAEVFERFRIEEAAEGEPFGIFLGCGLCFLLWTTFHLEYSLPRWFPDGVYSPGVNGVSRSIPDVKRVHCPPSTCCDFSSCECQTILSDNSGHICEKANSVSCAEFQLQALNPRKQGYQNIPSSTCLVKEDSPILRHSPESSNLWYPSLDGSS